MRNNNKEENTKTYVFSSIYTLGKFIGIGWIIVTPVVIFTYGGNFLDNQLNLGNLMTLLGLMIGLFVGIICTVRILKS
tara:strand:- start:1494 stop:1727 length:234 start_codon:yes stop_codon:yes gene_type:complete